ncbi:hypothetical protein OHB12_04760 [Nocardia sp. NBC_01730]|uniref:hypothetical protein n=1 Tax=Nocardia sp. NBC_01730 TaxID=2975998 RepID=UPI002E10DFFC|nr:hypothetical protein OHB12_04760 [Nocardia sp. NBC_01730]
MTRAKLLAGVVGMAAVVAGGCSANTTLPVSSNEHLCRKAGFASPFSDVDACTADATLTAAVHAVFSYRPGEQGDQRAAFRAARPLMDPRFAERAEPAALVWAPVSVTQWQQWRTDAVTITAVARVTSDDHSADTATSASRVLAVELASSDQSAIGFSVYAHATRTSAGAAWLLSGLEVLS